MNAKEYNWKHHEVRLHGRGGQGVLVAATILVRAFIAEGKYATALPLFGGERRGAPISAYLRYSDFPIRLKTQVYDPDCVLVVDPVQVNWPQTFQGLKPGGILIVNGTEPLQKKPHENVKLVGVVDASGIASEEMGRAIANTGMVGAFAAVTKAVGLDSIISGLEAEGHFPGDMLQKNIKCARRGWEEVKITQFN